MPTNTQPTNTQPTNTQPTNTQPTETHVTAVVREATDILLADRAVRTMMRDRAIMAIARREARAIVGRAVRALTDEDQAARDAYRAGRAAEIARTLFED